MAALQEIFQHPDNNENNENGYPARTDSPSPYRESVKRMEALNGFNRISRAVAYKYDEVNDFIRDTGGKLEGQPFFHGLQDHLTELEKRFHKIWDEVDEAEDRGGIAGGLTIGPLRGKTSQIETIWNTL